MPTTTKPRAKCCMCGGTDRLHAYGQLDAGLFRELYAPAQLARHACEHCDPTTGKTTAELVAEMKKAGA